ncbi:methyltransferase domain-containing protein [Candidatus Uhrbacteria bacterium]|nr:methyltransferase domain-containing protein [Candidatus Uhrbacteria bacterium]
MADGETKFKLIQGQYAAGHFDDEDLYDLLVRSIERNPRYYFEQITKSDLLKYMWRRFQAYPEALARALVRVSPELFYGNPEWVTRLIIRLQSDKRLGAELGMITIAPRRGTGAGSAHLAIRIDESLLSAIPREVQDLDVECRMRELLFWYSRDRDLGGQFAQECIQDAANAYEARVWSAARDQMERYFDTSYDRTVPQLNGRLFPAVHVRWWLERSRSEMRVLNIGDTGTYKTSYSAIAMREAGCRRVLVFCAPNARQNWARELRLYYPHLRVMGRIEVIESARDVEVLSANAEFLIVGYTTLIHRSVIDALKNQEIDGIIWDESQYGKNVIGSSPAKRALGALEIIHAHAPRVKKIVANSATPWENSPEEIAALACVLRPELFPDPKSFLRSGAYASPRFLRALLETCILDIGLHEVRDLPSVTPKPWEDLFGAVAVDMTLTQSALYQHLLDHVPEQDEGDDSLRVVNGVDGSQKVRYLLYACDMPHVLERLAQYDWPPEVEAAFEDWRLSAKLVWLRETIDQAIGKAKIVVASGLYVQGVTQPVKDDDEILWIGRCLREWYGEESVLLLDGSVAIGEERDALITRWREEERARILLVSTKTCPDSINLSVTIKPNPTLQELLVIGFAMDWKPWKQFLGRFYREGLALPMRYLSLVLRHTVCEARMDLNRRKWTSQTRFRSRVPPTAEEWAEYSQDDANTLSGFMRSPEEWVSLINNDVRGAGESSATAYLDRDSGLSTNGEIFARSFLAAQEHMASGHIARHMRFAIQEGLIPGGILTDPTAILDAGCGPATLARTLALPVMGVDLNPWMIDVAREVAPELAVNSQKGKLSELPREWTDRFRLTVSSMVLDWTALGSAQESERLQCLRELIRVTDPHGLIWLTFNHSSMDESLFRAWTGALKHAGCELLPLTGLVVPVVETTKKTPSFAFWSIVFTPAGKSIDLQGHGSFRLRFDVSHMKARRARGTHTATPNGPEPVLYDRFVVKDPSARVEQTDTIAVRQTLLSELGRWARVEGKPIHIGQRVIDLFGNDWRTLERLQQRGIISWERP